MAYKVLGLLAGVTALAVGGFKLYVQLYRQRLGWTRSLKEKIDGATRNRISDILRTEEDRPGPGPL